MKSLTVLVCRAVRERRVLAFVYRGGVRRVEPYCHGYARREEVLLGRQIGGYTTSGDPQRWRLFHVARTEGLRASEEAFEPAVEEYDRDNPHPAIDEIHCRVE